MRTELKNKYFEAWGNAFSKKDDDIIDVDSPVELVAVTRKSVAKANDVEFITPVPKKRRIHKGKKKDKNQVNKKFNWDYVYIVVLLGIALNLFFTSGGIIDLVQSKARIVEGEAFLKQIEEENIILKQEINNLKYNTKYQKKITREHLGAIAQDEYLIIFSD